MQDLQSRLNTDHGAKAEIALTLQNVQAKSAQLEKTVSSHFIELQYDFGKIECMIFAHVWSTLYAWLESYSKWQPKQANRKIYSTTAGFWTRDLRLTSPMLSPTEGLFIWGKVISVSQIILFCSYGETLSRLPGKVSDCDVALSKSTIEKLLTRQKVFPLSGKVGVHMGKTLSRVPRSRLSTSEISVHRKTFRLIWTQWNFSYYFHNKARSRL